VLEKQRIWN